MFVVVPFVAGALLEEQQRRRAAERSFGFVLVQRPLLGAASPLIDQPIVEVTKRVAEWLWINFSELEDYPRKQGEKSTYLEI